MKLRDILSHKGRDIYSTTPTDSLATVVRRLVEQNCGALVVLDGERLAGIISERDVLRACADLTKPMDALVGEHMSSDLVTAGPDDDVEHVMGLMTQHRIRHLPIVESGSLAGVISIGDVVKAQHDELSYENQFLKQYIQG